MTTRMWSRRTGRISGNGLAMSGTTIRRWWTDQPVGQRGVWAIAQLLSRQSETGEQGKKDGRVRRIYGPAQTPLARVLASAEVSAATKVRLRAEKGGLEPLCAQAGGDLELKAIAAMRRSGGEKMKRRRKIGGPSVAVPLCWAWRLRRQTQLRSTATKEGRGSRGARA
jgi:hypothetical protein